MSYDEIKDKDRARHASTQSLTKHSIVFRLSFFNKSQSVSTPTMHV